MRLPICLAVFLMITLPVCAANHKDELKKVQTDLASQKEKQQNLAKEQQDIEGKMDDLQKDLVKITREVQKHEQAALKLHDAEQKTEDSINDANQKLQSQRKSLATTIMALERLNQMPPQALLARPSAPIDMARSSDLLQKVIPAVSEQAQQIKIVVKNLQDLHDMQAQQETALKDEQEQLAAQQEKLESTVKERQTLLAQNKSKQKAILEKVTTLNSRASDIQDLMQRIEKQSKRKSVPEKPAKKTVEEPEEETTTDTEEEKPDIVKAVKNLFDNVVSSLGSARLPVTGHIATQFGAQTSEGVVSQGITIAARSGSVVTAPSGGVIRFAGPFRQYKLLVIIQHSNGDHSLIGGMQELYTQTGATVVTGEPLGKLPENYAGNAKLAGDSTTSTSLYYERRRNGKPIDPRLVRG